MMRRLLVVTCLLSAAALPSRAEFRFVDAKAANVTAVRNVCGDVGTAKGWLSEEFGAGAAWLDYDGDGKLDLYLVNGSTYDRKPGAGEPNRLFRGDGKGGFQDVTDRAGVGDRGWGYGVAVADYDGDGDSDLYVTNFGANVLYRNDGDGTFSDVTKRAGVGDDRMSTAAAFFDYDGDGDLDLYVGNYMVADPKKVPRSGTDEARAAGCQYKGIDVSCGPLGQVPLQDVLYRNDGDGTFTDATRDAGVFLGTPRFSLGAVAADFDNDGRTDLYVANDSVQNSLWKNAGGGKLRDVGLVTLSGLNGDGMAQAGMGTDFGDFDGNGFVDLVATNYAHDLNTVYRNVEGRMFLDESSTLGMQVTYLMLSWGTGWHDFDADGDLDLFIANGHVYPEVDDYDVGTSFRQRNHLFENADRKLKEVGAASGPGLAIEKSFRAAAFADYDDDGDVDIFLTALDDTPVLLRNDSEGGHWLQVRLIGKGANTDAVGARVTVEAGGKKFHRQRKGGGSYLSAHDPRLHFGLGAVDKITQLKVVWPDGTTLVRADVPIDQVIEIRQK